MNSFTTSRRLLGSLAVLAATTPALAISVQVTIENLAPANETFLTPVWGGFHDGSFDLYNSGEAASMALERIAEDGNTAPLNAAFLAAMPSGVDGVIANGGPIALGAGRWRPQPRDTARTDRTHPVPTPGRPGDRAGG
ncbi:MAG: spondin domain-containing protein [Verrucomicrobia bacterium]|nr:spondin domain-containing protein [Verrucomicrobiota bacterium]